MKYLTFPFDMGFIKYFNICSPYQFNESSPTVRKFSNFLLEDSNYDTTHNWVKEISAPPLHHYLEWANIKDVKKRWPTIFPSVHILRELSQTNQLNG